ncbi:MAG: hypothetical protein VXW31_07955, partial [Planctomycetota bacterium]|nr:hypothetical protein [Planctomycetota bacterium]
MDLDTSRGHLEIGGNGANVITGKLKAVAGLFRKDRKTTKSSQHGSTIADIEDGTMTLGNRKKDEKETWGAYFARKSYEYLDEDNLTNRTWIGKKLQKGVGNTIGGLARITGDTGVEATWRVAAGWDINLDGSGTCDDDCAAGTFEEDPWSLSIEAQANLAAYTKIYGI